jgi:hypothetical protein
VPIALAIGSSALTVWTLSPQSVSDRSTAKSDLTRHGLLPSGLDVQFLRSSHAGVPVTRCTDFTDGLKHTLIAAVAGILAIAVLSTGSGFRAVRHGQVCFTLAAGMLIGCYTALSLAPVRSALWSVLATPLIAVLGYAWASFVGEPLANPFLRILPVQMISVGVAAAITTIWYHAAPDVEAMNDAAAGRGGGSVGSGL